MKFTPEQIEHWQQLWNDALKDSSWVQQQKELDAHRNVVRGEIVDYLNQFDSGVVSLTDFRATFDRKTRSEWDGFGLKAMNGAMFLNMLVKHIPDSSSLTKALKSALALPKDEKVAREQLSNFSQYLEILIESGKTTRRQLQPARSSALLSAFWHLQEPEVWPVFYSSGQSVLRQEKIYSPSNDSIADYFSFRDCYLSLTASLGLRVWDLEHLIYRLEDGQKAMEDEPTPDSPVSPTATLSNEIEIVADESKDSEDIGHSRVQLLLAKIGKKLNCKVWIASNDQNRQAEGIRLGDLSLDVLPNLGLDPQSQKTIQLIDVLWLKGNNQIVAAFEVEHSTSIYSGLLRMSDLVAQLPNLSFPLYIVAPDWRMPKVRQQLSRPTFQKLELHEVCWFFTCEALIREANNIMNWANDPSVIKNLASKVTAKEIEESL